MNDSKREIKKIYALLVGMYKASKENNRGYIKKNDIDKYNLLVNNLYQYTNQDEYINLYRLERDECDVYNSSEIGCYNSMFVMKVLPLLEYLEKIYIDTSDEVVQKIGVLYNSINDRDLQRRCGDILLEANSAFDRVINQATQILEDRIKKKAKLEKTALIGLPLVSKAVHSKLENTILKFSDIPDVQEQYSALFKGIIGVYRNPTHHSLEYECTREEALKFCAFIDLLLADVDKSELLIESMEATNE